jgi:hypothetical protein
MRAAPAGVSFHPSVVDNEELGRRRSKVCCIFRSEHERCEHGRNNYERL